MPSEGWLFLCGVVSLLLFTGAGLLLSARRIVPAPVTIALIFAGVALVCIFPNLGNLGSVLLPGGVRAEFAANRAVAAKDEVVKLANQVQEAKQKIGRVHDEMRAAFKSIVEAVYLSTVHTREQVPLSAAALDRMLGGLEDIARYAYPDPKQREPWLREMKRLVMP